MNFRAFLRNKLILILPLIAFVSLIYISGCDDAGVETKETPLGNDSDVVAYNNLSVTYSFNGSNDTSYIAVNLWTGQIERDLSSTKDMTLRDSVNTFQNFYFRSGDLTVDVPGFQTRFYKIFNDYTQVQFDSLKSIDAGTTLDSLDFTQDDTRGGDNGVWGYFNAPLTSKPVYSFYLKGKFAAGVTAKRIYGVIYFKEAVLGTNTFSLTFDVRLNKNGDNWFKKL
jgi:hypothetical protein